MFLLEPQPTSFDLRFGIFGIPVRVHPLFWLVAGLLGGQILDRGVEYMLIWIACVFLSILLHELGHVVVGMLFGARGYIVLYSLGGMAIGSNTSNRRWQRIAVSFAGPLAQFILYGALWLLIPFIARDFLRGRPLLLFATASLLVINLYWPILNLLPIWPLDGGKICREVCEGLTPQKGKQISLVISMLTAGLLAANSFAAAGGHPLVPYFPAGGLFTAIFFAMMAVENFLELQRTNDERRWQDDHWDDWRR